MTAETTADLCEAYLPYVFGGEVDQWGGYIVPGAWRGTEWPCPGQTRLRVPGEDDGVCLCSCGCHRGEFTHELPPWAGPERTAVHPTEV